MNTNIESSEKSELDQKIMRHYTQMKEAQQDIMIKRKNNKKKNETI